MPTQIDNSYDPLQGSLSPKVSDIPAYNDYRNHVDMLKQEQNVEQESKIKNNNLKQSVTNNDNTNDISEGDVASIKKELNQYMLNEDDFPIADFIMGLPPIGSSSKSADGFDVYDQLVASFPVLKIKPCGMTLQQSNSSEKWNVREFPRLYKFAVQPDSAISYSHSNNYGPSSITQNLQSLMTMSTAGELRQLSMTSGSMFGKGLSAGLQDINRTVSESLRVIQGIMREHPQDDTIRHLSGMGMDTLRGLLTGARIDFPNIWQGSQTSMSWNFTIELRTMSTNPKDPQYIKDIILPLTILLKLCLPVGGFNLSYLEPPYVKVQFGNTVDIRLGGIVSAQWSVPMNEMTFAEIPQHVTFSLTVTDLYNVMLQGRSLDSNKDISTAEIPTLERFMDKFSNPVEGKEKIPNELIWKNEFSRNSGTTAYNQKNVAPNVKPTVLTESVGQTLGLYDFDLGSLAGDMGIQTIDFSMLPENTLSMTMPELHDATFLKLSNVTDVYGNTDMMSALQGKHSLLDVNDMNLNLSSFNSFNLNDINAVPFTSQNKFAEYLSTNNLLDMSNGVISKPPQNMLDKLSISNGNILKEVCNDIDSFGDITSSLKMVSKTVQSVPDILSDSMLSKVADATKLMSSVVGKITNSDPILENELRLVSQTQAGLSRICDEINTNVYKAQSVVNDLNAMNELFVSNEKKQQSFMINRAVVNMESAESEEVNDIYISPDFIEFMTKMMNVISVAMTTATIETLFNSKSQNNKKIVYLNVKK